MFGTSLRRTPSEEMHLKGIGYKIETSHLQVFQTEDAAKSMFIEGRYDVVLQEPVE